MVLSLDWWYLEMEPGLFLSLGSFVLRLWLCLFGELQFWGGEEPQTGEEVAAGGWWILHNLQVTETCVELHNSSSQGETQP